MMCHLDSQLHRNVIEGDLKFLTTENHSSLRVASECLHLVLRHFLTLPLELIRYVRRVHNVKLLRVTGLIIISHVRHLIISSSP